MIKQTNDLLKLLISKFDNVHPGVCINSTFPCIVFNTTSIQNYSGLSINANVIQPWYQIDIYSLNTKQGETLADQVILELKNWGYLIDSITPGYEQDPDLNKKVFRIMIQCKKQLKI